MKTILHFLKEYFLLQRFQIYVLMLLMVFSLSSCFQKYYNTNTASKADPVTLEKLQVEKKLFILHTPGGAFPLKDISVDRDMISGVKASPDSRMEKCLVSKTVGTHRFRMKEKDMVLNEVHLYTNMEFSEVEKVNLGINQIFRMDVYGFDKKATNESKVISIVGITVAVGAVVGAAAILNNEMSHMFDNMPLNIPL